MRHKYSRRGILLLLILALMAMFGMVAVAFVVLSSQTLKATKSGQRMEKSYHPLQNELDEAAMQVIRGTINPISKLAPHSLLEDIYGAGSLSALSNGNPLKIYDPVVVANSAVPVCGGQLIDICIDVETLATNPNLADDIANLKRRVGSILTIIGNYDTQTGQPDRNYPVPGFGLSTRIVGINPVTGNLQIMAFSKGEIPTPVVLSATRRVCVTVLINGMPFSGTGAGANPYTGNLDLNYAYNTDANVKRFQLVGNLASGGPYMPVYPAALLPFLPNSTYSNVLTNPQTVPFSQVNEDYDAADFQNMLLATPPILSSASFIRGVNQYTVNANRFIPTMHRPALVNYWYQQLFNDWVLSGIPAAPDRWWTIFHPVDALQKGYIQSPSGTLLPRWNTAPTPAEIVAYILDLKRNIIGRPLTDDHPNFNGSNPTSLSSYYDTTLASPQQFSWEGGDIFPPPDANTTPPYVQPPHWDVDNDGDGIPDSNWIDIGLPIRSTPDGRHYKPLVAIYCLDMDGRLNLNAHGNLTQTQAGYYTQVNSAGTPLFTDYAANYFAGAKAPPLRRGRGFGPADINLAGILGTSYQQVLSGNAAAGIEGRYGSDQLPGYCTDGLPKIFYTLPITIESAANEQRKYNDYLSANKWFDFDGIRNSTGWSVGNAAAVGGVSGWAVNSELPDPSGKGILGVDPAGRPIVQSLQNTFLNFLPYELNLNPQTIRGLPFTSSASDPPDNPFSVNELERILRQYDVDGQSQSTRLASLTSPYPLIPNQSILYDHRNEITTESWDVPVYTAGLPSHIITQVQTDLPLLPNNRVPDWYKPTKVTDLLKGYYYFRLRKGGETPPDASTHANDMVNNLTQTQLLQLFPPELLAGLKMNINHPFAGPVDILNNRNYNMAVLWQNSGIGGNYGQIWFGQMPDYPDGTNDIAGAPYAARQRYARYLFVLAMLLQDRDQTSGDPAQSQWFSAAPSPPAVALSVNDKEELSRRRIAQWAINAACYKVNDSIMVPFEYDEDPFYFDPATHVVNCWRVDGLLGTTAFPSADDAQSYRALVWGCKPPEAILTETLAFHNLRVADTAFDNATHTKYTLGDPNKDQDWDQTRLPQGSAFFEIYCPRDLHGTTPPPDLYDSAGRLELGKLAPQDANGFIYPVWRMVVSESTRHDPKANDIQTRVNNNFDAVSLEPEQYRNCPTNDKFTLLKTKTATDLNVPIDRIVWFCNQAPTHVTPPTAPQPGVNQHYDVERIYWNRTGIPTLPLNRGNYAIIGPRKTTRFSLTTEKNVDPECQLGKPGKQTIIMPAAGSPYVTSITSGTPDANITTPGKIKLPMGIIVAGTPWNWAHTTVTAPDGIGINISEPVFDNYYTEPDYQISAPTTWTDEQAQDWYGDPKMADVSKYFPNNPEDSKAGRPLGDDKIIQADQAQIPNSTIKNYKTVFLQRLANPLAAFDPVTNPYRTVDWMPIDLTVYTGEDKSGNNTKKDDPTELRFTSRQRLDSMLDPAIVAKYPAHYFNIWNPLLSELPRQDIFSTGSPYLSNANFSWNLLHSLGYLNRACWVDPKNPNLADNWINSTTTLKYSDGPQVSDTNNNPIGFPTESIGDPFVNPYLFVYSPSYKQNNQKPYPSPPSAKEILPFPWLPWFGRPYVSELELMMVPSSHPARLLMEFKPCTLDTKHYEPTSAAEQPFDRQLLNFLQSNSGNQMNQFHRILDYVGVPSWYAGTEIQANPTLASNTAGTDAQHWFHTPYNRISTYREPGRINLNTIYSPDVFRGLMDTIDNSTMTTEEKLNNQVDNLESFEKLILSRRGDGTTAAAKPTALPNSSTNAEIKKYEDETIVDYKNNILKSMISTNAISPTEFLANFRSSGNAPWVPQGVSPWVTGTMTIPPDNIKSGLMRPSLTSTNDPLFTFNKSQGTLIKDTSGKEHLDITDPQNQIYDVTNPYRNSYFHYSDLMRMANLTTTRSNVYSLWITVGYFEVTPATVKPNSWMTNLGLTQPQLDALMQQIYPDGCELGQELGSDTGEIVRHRGFYIIDRSIPVGFQRGQDLNVEKAILLKRIIE